MLSVSSQRKYNFYHQNTFLDASRANSRNIIGRNPLMAIPLSANQDLTPMLRRTLVKSSFKCDKANEHNFKKRIFKLCRIYEIMQCIFCIPNSWFLLYFSYQPFVVYIFTCVFLARVGSQLLDSKQFEFRFLTFIHYEHYKDLLQRIRKTAR